jgi:flagellar basal-body rod protein FlgB
MLLNHAALSDRFNAAGFHAAWQTTPVTTFAVANQGSSTGCNDCSGPPVMDDRFHMQSLNSQIDLLSRLINASEMRHEAISQNIANVNTAGYRRLDVEFESLLAKELSSGGATTSQAKPVMRQDPAFPMRADGSNVDLDREVGALNKNALLQQTYLRLLGHNLQQMRAAIESR